MAEKAHDFVWGFVKQFEPLNNALDIGTDKHSNKRRMLRRSVLGLRVLKQWRSQTRRKLYHFGEQHAVSLPNAPLIHPHNSLVQHRESSPVTLGALERLLRVSGGDVHTADNKQKRKLLPALPQALQHRMNKSSDSHVRLDLMLDYKDPLRIPLEHLDHCVRTELHSSMSDVTDVVSDRTLLKLVKFYIIHRDYTKVASLLHHISLNRYQDVQFTLRLNAAVFDTLKKDSDLPFGFLDICKSLYALCGTDVKLFKFCFTTLTNNGMTLKELHFKHYMFLDILKIVQLDTVLRSCDDVHVLPPQYWTTHYDYIDVSLSTKLIKLGQTEEAMKHLRTTSGLEMDGLFHRMVQPACKDDKQCIALEILPSVRAFGQIDKEGFRKIQAKPKFYKTCFSNITSPVLLYELQTIHLTKLIKSGKLLSAKQFINHNLSNVNHLGLSSLISLMLIINDERFVKKVVSQLSPSNRSIFLDLSLKRTYATLKKCKEPMSPESQIPKIDQLLRVSSYEVTDLNLETLSSFLISLPMQPRLEMIKRLKGPSSGAFMKLLIRCKSIALISELLKQNRFKTRFERIGLCQTLVAQFGINDINSLLNELSTRDFESLHPKITHCFITKNDISSMTSLLQCHPHPPSQHLFNDHLFQASPELMHTVTPRTPTESLQVQTYSRLMDTSRLFMDKTLRLGIRQLKSHKQLNQKTLVVLVLKQAVERTKLCNRGSVVMNERLKWAKDQCVKYDVPQGVIEGIMR